MQLVLEALSLKKQGTGSEQKHKLTGKKYNLPSLKLTSPLEMDGWKTTFLLGWLPGSGYVSLRAGIFSKYHLVQLPVSGGLAV